MYEPWGFLDGLRGTRKHYSCLKNLWWCCINGFFLLRKQFSNASRTQKRLPTAWLPDGSAGKEFACNVGDMDSIPELGRSFGEGNGYPLQYCGLENSMGTQRVRQDWATFTFTYGTIQLRNSCKLMTVKILIYLFLSEGRISPKRTC